MWHPQETHEKCQNQPAYLKCSACSYGEGTLNPRWILAFPNGDELHNGTRILVSPTYLKNFDNLLETLTKQLKPKFGAVRKIYSPNSGSSVRCLRELKPNHKYVVAGREKLRKLPLGYLTEEERELQNYKRKLKERQCKEVYSSTEPSESPRVTPRYWLEAEKRRRGTIVIFVHRNGDSFDRPLRLVLTEKDRKCHTWWGLTVQEIENRLKVHPIRTFYTRCGEEVHTPYGLKNGRAYIAVCRNEKFISVPYRSHDGVPLACCLEKGSICHLVKSVPGYCESHNLKEQIFGATQKQCSAEAIKPSNINDVYVAEVEYPQNGKKSQSHTKESQNTDQTLPNENDNSTQFRQNIERDKSDNATMPMKNETSHREVATQVPEGQQPMQELKPTNIQFRKTGEKNAKCFPRCRQKHNHEKPVHSEVKRVTAKRNHSPGMDEFAMLQKRRNEKEMKQAGDFKRRDRKKLNGRNKSKGSIGKRHRPLFKIGRKGNVFPACKQQSRPVSKQLLTRQTVYRSQNDKNGVQEEITTEMLTIDHGK
ncbi:doublecortin domain-containing protein 2-like isoform X2 [Ischnura elegans]|uniref:doublecortin domain-containing protein 2-like isoform X2 n=1 Tax=Ischnura elegans TaxID=197161 RepID=UPI001ED87F57|nr:doublecortin domain-containing protein 2-like isoform X2 [Ischnura elegans]